MGAIVETYARSLRFAFQAPLAMTLVLAAELLQHAVELRLGMYAGDGSLSAEAAQVRLMFGAVKVAAMVLVVIFALRVWRFEDEAGRAGRLTIAFFVGLGLFLLVQAGGELLAAGAGWLLARIAGPGAGQGSELAFAAAPLLAWMVFATLLLPWYVGLLTEDRAMTLGRSIRGIGWRFPFYFLVYLAGFLPLTIVHYALGTGAVGRPLTLAWMMMGVDAAIVALLAATLASTLFTLYRRADARAG